MGDLPGPAAAVPLAGVLSGPLPAPERATPEEAARGFEALLAGQLLRQQSEPLLGETLLSGGQAGQLFRELLLETFARVAAERDAFGIGRELLAQMRGRETAARAGEQGP